MTNDLKNFLEEEYRNMRTQSLVEHDDKLINFVLSLVEKEVEKEAGEGTLVSIKDISTIIKQLRV